MCFLFVLFFMHRDSIMINTYLKSASSRRDRAISLISLDFQPSGRFRLRELFRCCDDGREILEKRDCFLDGEL